MSNLCKLRHRKNLLNFFRKFISQERHTGIPFWIAYCGYFNLFFKGQLGFSQKMIFTKLRSKLWIFAKNYEIDHLLIIFLNNFAQRIGQVFCEKLELSRIVKFRDNFAADNDLKAASIIKNLSPAKPGTLNKIIYHLACQDRPKLP